MFGAIHDSRARRPPETQRFRDMGSITAFAELKHELPSVIVDPNHTIRNPKQQGVGSIPMPIWRDHRASIILHQTSNIIRPQQWQISWRDENGNRTMGDRPVATCSKRTVETDGIVSLTNDVDSIVDGAEVNPGELRISRHDKHARDHVRRKEHVDDVTSHRDDQVGSFGG